MKILAINSVGLTTPDKESMVDRWRIYHPLEELKKHVDWQIDYQKSIIPGIEKYKDKSEFTDEELEKAAKHLGSYDIIFTSYFASPTAFSLLHVVNERYGTKLIIDDDDDIFSIDPENPYWLKMGDNETFAMQRMIRLAPYISTTNQVLKDRYSERSEVNGRIFINPNYISDAYKQYDPKNEDKIVIGFFGGSAHYNDLHNTGVTQALARLMHKYKNVHFHTAGVPVNDYLPRKRYKVLEPSRGQDWYDKMFPSLNFDISIAPLEDTLFNQAKSNIKWQESTRMGASVVASNIGPFNDLTDCATLVNNTEDDWYIALERLLDPLLRKKQVHNARIKLSGMTLEKNWGQYKRMFEEVYNANN